MSYFSWSFLAKGFCTSLLCIFACSTRLSAQVPQQVDQYIFNSLVLNPASAGSREVLHGALMVRRQWTGFANAPFLGTFALDGVSKSRRNGFGILASLAGTGPLQQGNLNLSYAYRLPIGNGKLAFGLSGGISTIQLKSSRVATTDPGDIEFLEDSPVLLAPEAGFGIWYENPKFYLGASAPKLLGYYGEQYNLFAGEAGRTPYFLGTGGALFTLSPKVKLKSTFLVKYIPEIPIQTDLNLFLIAKDLVWLGAGWRSNQDWIFSAGIQLNQQLHLAYAYSLSRPELRPWNSGSHNLTLSYDFGYQIDTDRPRYYW